MEEATALVRRIKAASELAGLGSNRALGHELGVSETTVKRWLNGGLPEGRKLDDLLERIARACSVPVSFLVGGGHDVEEARRIYLDASVLVGLSERIDDLLEGQQRILRNQEYAINKLIGALPERDAQLAEEFAQAFEAGPPVRRDPPSSPPASRPPAAGTGAK